MRRKQSEYSRPAAAANRPTSRQRKGKYRLCLILLLLLAAACVGLVRQFLHFLNDTEQPRQTAAENAKEHASALPALRGAIYDRHLHELAVSYQLFSLHAHPDELTDRQAEAEKLALIIGTGKDMLLQQMQNGDAVVELADNLNQEQAKEAAALHLPGIRLQPAEARCYPGHAAAGHLLGFVSDGIGLSGAEALCDNLLQPGEFRKAEALGIDFAGQESLGPKAADIILTIDFTLQKKLEQLLSKHRQDAEAASGSALVLNMESGAMLAAVRQPGFDPNYFWKSKEDSALFPQTFSAKLLAPLLTRAAAVRHAGAVEAVPPDLISPLNHGLGQEELAANWQEFGFDLIESELSALAVQLKKRNEQQDDAKLSALQMAAGAAALFNSGKRLKPWLLRAVYDPDNDHLFLHDPDASAPRRIMPPADGVLLRQNLLHHSRWGHAQGFLFANRTVFAEPARNGLQEQHMQELLLLAAPGENPSLLLLLAVDYGRLEPSLPSAGEETEEEAPPEEEDLGQLLLALLNDYAKEKESPVQKPPAEKNETNMRRFFLSRQLSLPPTEEEKPADSSGRIMPDVKGLSLRKALQRLNPCKLKIQIHGSGKIRQQRPAAGTSLAKIDRCTLLLTPAPVKRLKPTPKKKIR